jgi:hypothetical protein
MVKPYINKSSREVQMTQHFKCVLLAIAVSIFATAAKADDVVREMKTEKGKAVVFTNFLGTNAGCSTDPTPQPFPVLREKPLNGTVGMQITAIEIAASGDCPARKVPALALFYLPKPDFVGTDFVQIEVDTGAIKTTIAGYRITVQSPESK